MVLYIVVLLNIELLPKPCFLLVASGRSANFARCSASPYACIVPLQKNMATYSLCPHVLF